MITYNYNSINNTDNMIYITVQGKQRKYGLHVSIRDGEPYFLASDITDDLGILNSRDAIRKELDREDIRKIVVQGIERNFVSLNGLYTLAEKTRAKHKQDYRDWVLESVIIPIKKWIAKAKAQESNRKARVKESEKTRVLKLTVEQLELLNKQLDRMNEALAKL